MNIKYFKHHLNILKTVHSIFLTEPHADFFHPPPTPFFSDHTFSFHGHICQPVTSNLSHSFLYPSWPHIVLCLKALRRNDKKAFPATLPNSLKPPRVLLWSMQIQLPPRWWTRATRTCWVAARWHCKCERADFNTRCQAVLSPQPCKAAGMAVEAYSCFFYYERVEHRQPFQTACKAMTKTCLGEDAWLLKLAVNLIDFFFSQSGQHSRNWLKHPTHSADVFYFSV